MSIFVIFRVSRPEILGPLIAQQFPNDFYEVADNEWLVSAHSTAKEVASKLGLVGSGENGSAIVFKMDSYYGRAPTDIWDWVKTKSEDSA